MQFQELIDAIDHSGEKITKQIDRVFCNPSYSTHRIAGSASSDYEGLILKYMASLVNLQFMVMDVRAHRYIFCSLLQFKIWCKLLIGQIEE